MANTLGQTIRAARKNQQLTQKATAQNICAQSMLSAIENDKYVPNAQLLIQLCQRLNINLETLSLSKDYSISQYQSFNQQLEELCNQHQYPKLHQFLKSEETIAAVQSASQTQAYYYYLAVAQWHEQRPVAAIQTLKLSLAQSSKNIVTTLTRLSWASLGWILVNQGQQQIAQKLIKESLQHLELAIYEENQNILFYLAALVYRYLSDFSTAFTFLEQGIDFATRHNSHYLLSNYYYLLAQLAHDSGQPKRQHLALQHQQFLSELFGEKIYHNL
ncbi:MAG: helix-turn-helix transcriptional regulator [Lactobacillus sp.]|uniref:XRE family transcriptional regulator n=1 Tax=Bombilactobacillus bombi TaxID=1303590 RepID=A0A3R7CK15_9LACO|nr:helix-turn-helix transcriptional regulator [Bombilactobacillus bombi]MCO6543331.1 helix-turn-helix transcriptional regulator [Lactobacillus sp.]RHW44868.1 XRE family transcriptional regulator [Bombilactobacillus bombi]RHW51225.1 XRE family transcriptional regulator [Bombilactobacillus bombi]